MHRSALRKGAGCKGQCGAERNAGHAKGSARSVKQHRPGCVEHDECSGDSRRGGAGNPSDGCRKSRFTHLRAPASPEVNHRERALDGLQTGNGRPVRGLGVGTWAPPSATFGDFNEKCPRTVQPAGSVTRGKELPE